MDEPFDAALRALPGMRHLACLLLCMGPLAGTAVAQPAGDISLTPVEIAAAFSYDIRGREQPAADRGAGGGIVSVSGNLNDHFAVTAEFAASPRMTSIAAGPRVSTGFYRDGAGNIPGRFFAAALIGRHDGGGASPGTAIQLGAGADVLVVRRGLSLHWALDYLFTPGSRRDLSGARVSVGVLVGPHRAR